ncbi:acetyltransferase [Xylaria sp. CBS 124048]|nr:acetyltransferase [Xylaria sp. CBS 124048]
MSSPPTFRFHVRRLDEGPEDIQFLIASFDAALPYLAAIGSADQWRSQPFSERPDVADQLKELEQVRRYQRTGDGDPIQMFIAEAEIPPSAVDELPASVHVRTAIDKKKLLAVGSVRLLEGICPAYVRAHFDQDPIRRELDGATDYVYLEALITDYRTGSWRKGSGAMLVEYARQFCREKGKKALYLDAFAGNGRKLVKYYEKQGFSVVDDFEHPVPNGSKWPGALLRMDIV